MSVPKRWRAQRTRACSTGSSTGLDALQGCGAIAGDDGPPSDGQPLVLAGAGAASDALAQVAADLAGCPIVVPDLPWAGAAGAAVQAAALVHLLSPQQVAAEWALGAGRVVERSEHAAGAAAAGRAAYRSALMTIEADGNDLKRHRTPTKQAGASRHRSS